MSKNPTPIEQIQEAVVRNSAIIMAAKWGLGVLAAIVAMAIPAVFFFTPTIIATKGDLERLERLAIETRIDVLEARNDLAMNFLFDVAAELELETARRDHERRPERIKVLEMRKNRYTNEMDKNRKELAGLYSRKQETMVVHASN